MKERSAAVKFSRRRCEDWYNAAVRYGKLKTKRQEPPGPKLKTRRHPEFVSFGPSRVLDFVCVSYKCTGLPSHFQVSVCPDSCQPKC